MAERIALVFWHWHMSFLSPILHCVIRKFGYLQKYGYFLLELYPKPRTLLRHIDHQNVLSAELHKTNDQSVINWTVVGQSTTSLSR